MCWQIGGPDCVHPDYLKEKLSLRQIAGWIAWLRKEPRGDRRADARTAHQTAAFREVFIEGSEDPNNFLLRFRDTTKIADPEIDQMVDEFLSPQQIREVR